MSKPAYQGAFSRRFSNYAASDYAKRNPTLSKSDQKPTYTLRALWDGSMGRVLISGQLVTDTKSTPANSASSTAEEGDTITLTATPLQGFHFLKWVGGPVGGSTSKTVTVKMLDNYDVEAVFAADVNKPDGGGEDPNYLDFVLEPAKTDTTGKVKAFVKKWWWAILIVALIVYDYCKGAKK